VKRDMDLIRTILLKIEADPRFDGSLFHSIGAGHLGITDHTHEEVLYHAAMLIDADFLLGNAKLAPVGHVMVSKLTWAGHDFIDSVRDPTIWENALERAVPPRSPSTGQIVRQRPARRPSRTGQIHCAWFNAEHAALMAAAWALINTAVSMVFCTTSIEASRARCPSSL
jgi:hypothetical protein